MSRKFLTLCVSAAALLALTPAKSQAAGFYLLEQSVSGLGSAFSGSTTNLPDASTAYFNPAGMVHLEGLQTHAGLHVIFPTITMENKGSTTIGGGAISGGNGGNPYQPSPVPNLFATYQVNDWMWAGLGVTAPFGLANEYKDGWFGRYDALETELSVIDVAPVVGFKINDKLSIGGGINIQKADAKLTSAASAGVTEGVSKLKGDDVSVGWNVGIQYSPWESTTFGASYRSAIGHELEGRMSATGTTVADFNVAGKAALDLPDIAIVGVSHDMNEKLTLQGQLSWYGWNKFEDITAITDESFSILGGAITKAPGDIVSSVKQNYQTTLALSVGAEYDYDDNWTFRGGAQYDPTPTTDLYRTSRTPDGDRVWLSAGTTYKFNDKLTLDLAATYVWIDEQNINVTRNNSFSPATATTVNAGTKDAGGPIFAVGLNYKF
jgi:long-chain fatty acid transport protein